MCPQITQCYSTVIKHHHTKNNNSIYKDSCIITITESRIAITIDVIFATITVTIILTIDITIRTVVM